jgi:hypothetical protein
VLKAEMIPFGVPTKEMLLQGRQIRNGRLLNDAFKGQGLSSRQDTVKPPNDGKRGLAMIPNGNVIPVQHLKVGSVPFEGVFAALLLLKKDLRAEEANLQIREMVPLTLKDGDGASIIENFIAKTSLLTSDERTGDSIHGKRDWKINQGPRDKIGDAGTNALGAP